MGNKQDIKPIFEFNTIADYVAVIEQPPNEKEIKSRQGQIYIPIDILEEKMNLVFAYRWFVDSFESQVIANEMIGTLKLKYWHPIYEEWHYSIGTAGTQIRTAKGSQVMDISAKIKNALEMDYPNLKSSCKSNAIQEIGRTFGRGLRRDESIKANYSSSQILSEAKELNKLAGECETLNDFSTLLKGYSKQLRGTPEFQGIIKAQKERFPALEETNRIKSFIEKAKTHEELDELKPFIEGELLIDFDQKMEELTK